MKTKQTDLRSWRISKVACFIAAQLVLPIEFMADADARQTFNPELLELNGTDSAQVDLSLFDESGGQLPGRYRVDIFMNNEKVETREVDFHMQKGSDGKEHLTPCLSREDLSRYGVLVSKFSFPAQQNSACVDFSVIPQARSDFNFLRQQLLLSFPQTAVSSAARGWVDPVLWDEGIPALMLNYSASGSHTNNKTGDSDSDSQYVNLRPGINIGPWRLRNYTTWNRTSSSGRYGTTSSNWDTVYTYAQRNIKSLNSQLTLGDSSTSADIFDSVSFRGAQLATDDEMMPESLRGYAPVVRGIARTNAHVTIRQNGYIIYENSVSPGAFEITDMYPTGGGGDLYVTIKESDGSEQQMVVPFASLPVLQREGKAKYTLTTAVYRSYDSSVDETPFSQGTFIYGLPVGITGYGGGQFSSKYQSLALGIGKNMGGLGAVSLDMTQAWSRMKDEARENGRAFRARYSKNFVESGTNFSIAGYRYATEGYWDLEDVLETYRDDNRSALFTERRRHRAELTVNQSLWKAGGSLALSAVREDYWNTSRKMESWSLSYNNTVRSVSFSLNYTFNKNSTANIYSGSGRTYDKDHLFSLSVSVPLSTLFGEYPTYASYMLNTSKKGNTTQFVGLNGSILEDNNLSWSVMEGYGSQGEGNTGGVNADWRASYGELSGGYDYDRYSQRINYGLAGSIVAHRNGVTFGQPLGETVALVAAPGAEDVRVIGQTGVKTDWAGYALVPYASPYRKNDITLDTQTFGDDTEVPVTTSTVVPTRGAVVRAGYQTSVGHRVLMHLTQSNGKAVPFGALVTLVNGNSQQSFIVGDNGQVYLSGLPDSGELRVRWGSDPDEQCHLNYTLMEKRSGIKTLSDVCRPG